MGPQEIPNKGFGVPGGVWTPISGLPYLCPIPIVDTHTTYGTYFPTRGEFVFVNLSSIRTIREQLPCLQLLSDGSDG